MQAAQRSVRIRRAISADVPAIIHVVNAAFAVESFLEGTRTDEQRMREMMSKGEFLVAETDPGKIVASVYVEITADRAYVGMLAVDPALQGIGLSRRMTSAVEQHCRERGCKFLDLTVLSLRPELLPLYRRFGFVETGTEEFHPSRPLKDGVACHKIQMSKPL